MKAKRRRVPVTTKATTATQDRFTMMRLDAMFEPIRLAGIEHRKRLGERHADGGRFGVVR